jgi:predicted dinucleotide-binding enzyme
MLSATAIAVVGTGRLGTALGRRLACAGHDLRIGSRDATRARETAASLGARFGGSHRDAAARAGVVVFAVPWSALPESLALLGDSTASPRRRFVAGDDLGFDAVDAGPLSSARYLEPLAGPMTTLDRVAGGRTVHGLELLRRERAAGGRDREVVLAAGSGPAVGR